MDETLIPDEVPTTAALVATSSAYGPPGLLPVDVAAAVRRHARALWRAAPTFPYCDVIGISSSEGLWGDLPHAPFADFHDVAAWIDNDIVRR